MTSDISQDDCVRKTLQALAEKLCAEHEETRARVMGQLMRGDAVMTRTYIGPDGVLSIEILDDWRSDPHARERAREGEPEA